MNIRVGFGFDVHPLILGHPFTLGGVLLPHDRGAAGHSDADVLVHAICDALLGAAGLRDIGVHFSNKDDQWKGISSLILLDHVFQMLREAKYKIENVDATVCLELPFINPYVPEMQQNIAEVCKLATSDISIKATTNEKLGFVGRNEGVTAYCVALINRSE